MHCDLERGPWVSGFTGLEDGIGIGIIAEVADKTAANRKHGDHNRCTLRESIVNFANLPGLGQGSTRCSWPKRKKPSLGIFRLTIVV